MSKIWSFVNDLKVKKNHKITMFIWFTTILYGLTGGLIWGLIGRLILPEITWLFCFIGYPAVFMGLFGGAIYLYNHEFIWFFKTFTELLTELKGLLVMIKRKSGDDILWTGIINRVDDFIETVNKYIYLNMIASKG